MIQVSQQGSSGEVEAAEAKWGMERMCGSDPEIKSARGFLIRVPGGKLTHETVSIMTQFLFLSLTETNLLT